MKCESEANADYNAAKNIGMRYVRRGQQSFRRTGNSQLALKYRTVTPSGEFTAHPDGFEAEFTDKPHLHERTRQDGRSRGVVDDCSATGRTRDHSGFHFLIVCGANFE